MSPSQHSGTHDSLWDERIQEALDDCLDAAARAAVDQHLQGCSPCRAHAEDLQRVDRALKEWCGRPRLDESFDRKLLRRIEGDGG